MKLNKRITTLLTVTTIVVGGSLYSVGAAIDAQPGTNADPVVTKSYVDTAISNLLQALNGGSGSSGNTGGTGEVSISTFVPVMATKGQTILGEEGTEIILRSGSAKSFSLSESGIVDVTTGSEYLNGSVIEPNHLIIVPREDGRGATITSDEAWFIIKGGYSVE